MPAIHRFSCCCSAHCIDTDTEFCCTEWCRNDAASHKGEDAMTIEALIILLIVGAIAGWLAGLIVKGYGLGLIGNIVVGIVGAFIASWLLPRIGIVIGGGVIAAIINATIGAVILLVILGLIRR
jgi:uncharacterized membrane protein YeaQ/YmgE (transglycosylase-associated protein family)